jgi:PAS domain S-box-containing protein
MNETSVLPQSVQSPLQTLPLAYTEVDARGVLTVANEAACVLHNTRAEEMIGHSIWDFVSPDEVAKSRAEFFLALAAGEDPPVMRRSLYTSRGGYRIHQLHRRLIRDTSGEPVGMSCITVDISELEARNRESKQAKLWLESALIAIHQSVIVTDALGFVRYINPAAERLTGWSSSEFVGMQLEKGIPILRAVSKGSKPLSFRITLQEPWHGDVELLTRERHQVAVWLSASPILDQETGYTNGVVIVMGSPRVADRVIPVPETLAPLCPSA